MLASATQDERMQILRMIEEHQITAEQGAQLLSTGGKPVANLSTPKPVSEVAAHNPAAQGRYFRVLVTDTTSGKVRTSVTIPLNLVRWGLKYGSHFSSDIEGIDLDELSEIITSGTEGKIVEVFDEEDGEHVQVFIE